MKKLILLLALATPTIINAQDFAQLSAFDLSDSMACKNAEPTVQKCSDFLLATPCSENLDRIQATQFLMRWMEATPDYSFGFNEPFFKTIKSDLPLVGIYMASQAKVALSGKPIGNFNEFQYESIVISLAYIEDPINGVKITGKLQKFIDAKKESTLKQMLE
jgi:hypothetical protein